MRKMERGRENGGTIHPFAVWVGVLGIGAAGVSGVGSWGQLGELNAAMEEQIRQAEFRGTLSARIDANTATILRNRELLNSTITKEGALELHKSQQKFIDTLIEFTKQTATKDELNLVVTRLKRLENAANMKR